MALKITLLAPPRGLKVASFFCLKPPLKTPFLVVLHGVSPLFDPTTVLLGFDMPENDSLLIFFAHLPPSNRAFFPPFPSFPLSSPSPWQLFHSLSPPNLPILVFFFVFFETRVYIRSFPTKNPFSKKRFSFYVNKLFRFSLTFPFGNFGFSVFDVPCAG